jgi:hypothetical protein
MWRLQGSTQLATSVTGPNNWSAVIGSLPKGLNTEERARLKSSVPPSPSANLLREMNAVSYVGWRGVPVLQ